MARLIFLLLVISFSAQAEDQLKISGGVEYGFNDTYDDRLINVDVSYLKNYDSNFTYGYSVGFYRMSKFTTPRDEQGKRYVIDGYHSLYACARAGVSVRPLSFIYAEAITGPCYFDKAKVLLSGNLQFNTEFGYGLRDPKTGSTIGIIIRHFSNAGISKPNVGANLYMISMGIALD